MFSRFAHLAMPPLIAFSTLILMTSAREVSAETFSMVTFERGPEQLSIIADPNGEVFSGETVYQVSGISGTFDGSQITGLSQYGGATNILYSETYGNGFSVSNLQSLSFDTANGASWELLGPAIAGQIGLAGSELTSPELISGSPPYVAGSGVTLSSPGGSIEDPVEISGYGFNSPIGGISEIASHFGSGQTDIFYQFYWYGGYFSSSAEVTPNVFGQFLPSSDIFDFELLDSNQRVVTLGDLINTGGYAYGALHASPLPAGTYEIGVAADTPVDPNLHIDFETTVGIPEPSVWALLLSGFALVGGSVRYRSRLPYRARLNSCEPRALCVGDLVM